VPPPAPHRFLPHGDTGSPARREGTLPDFCDLARSTPHSRRKETLSISSPICLRAERIRSGKIAACVLCRLPALLRFILRRIVGRTENGDSIFPRLTARRCPVVSVRFSLLPPRLSDILLRLHVNFSDKLFDEKVKA